MTPEIIQYTKSKKPHIDMNGRHKCGITEPHEGPHRCVRCGEPYDETSYQCTMPYRIHNTPENIESQYDYLKDNVDDAVIWDSLKKLGYGPPKIAAPKKKKAKKVKKAKTKNLPNPPPPNDYIPPPPPPEKELTVVAQRFLGQKDLEGNEVVASRDDFSAREYKKFMPRKRLEANRKKRKNIVDELGFIPQSIIPWGYRDRSANLDNYINDQLGKGSYADNTSNNKYIKGSEYEGKFRGLSQYSPRIAKFVLQYWGQGDSSLFLDNHTERLPRMLVAHMLGMDVVGFDLWGLTHDTNRAKMSERVLSAAKLDPENNIIHINNEAEFRATYNNRIFSFYRHNNQDMYMIPDNSVDFIFTSPPFWNIEKYGDEPGQAGNVDTYEQFMENQRKTMAECYRVLKPDRYIAYDMNNFHAKGKFYMCYFDTMKMLEKVGFTLHDEFIYEIGDLSKIWAAANKKRHCVAKLHCYVGICKKEAIK